MDREELQEIVDEFIENLAEQMQQLDAEITEGLEETIEDLERMGMSVEDAGALIMDVADPMGMVTESQEQAKENVSEFFDFLNTLDPEDQQEVKRMVRRGLAGLEYELNEFFSTLESLEAEENSELPDDVVPPE